MFNIDNLHYNNLHNMCVCTYRKESWVLFHSRYSYHREKRKTKKRSSRGSKLHYFCVSKYLDHISGTRVCGI